MNISLTRKYYLFSLQMGGHLLCYGGVGLGSSHSTGSLEGITFLGSGH